MAIIISIIIMLYKEAIQKVEGLSPEVFSIIAIE